MKFHLYEDINKYIDDVMDYLAAHEIQSNMIISNCLRAKNGMDTSNWFLGTIKDSEGELKIATIMTPPHNLLLYEHYPINDEAVELLAHEMESIRIPIPGVLADKSLAARFTDKYTSISGRRIKDKKNLRIYRLDKSKEIPLSSGRMRPADHKDLYYLPYWSIGFNQDCGHPVENITNTVEKVKRMLDEKTLFIWEDDVPVSQAAIGRRTLNGAVVNAVYTPPHYRGKGYASSCVANLSRHALESGYKFCSLFTDLSNPISNSIYMKMGYQPVCDYDEYSFAEEA